MSDHASDTLTFGGGGSMIVVGMAEPNLTMGVLGAGATVLGLGMKVYELWLKHRDYDSRILALSDEIGKLKARIVERDAWIKAESDRTHQPIPRMESDQ